jgi:hypothetical protein
MGRLLSLIFDDILFLYFLLKNIARDHRKTKNAWGGAEFSVRLSHLAASMFSVNRTIILLLQIVFFLI